MGFSGISIWQLLIILLIVLLIFGAKRLKNIGSDLGEAIKGFKKSINEQEVNKENNSSADDSSSTIYEAEYQKSETTQEKNHSTKKK